MGTWVVSSQLFNLVSQHQVSDISLEQLDSEWGWPTPTPRDTCYRSPALLSTPTTVLSAAWMIDRSDYPALTVCLFSSLISFISWPELFCSDTDYNDHHLSHGIFCSVKMLLRILSNNKLAWETVVRMIGSVRF